MSHPPHRGARILIVAGFAITILASLIDLVNVFASGTYRVLVFSGKLAITVTPGIAIAATIAWFFLLSIEPLNDAQQVLLNRVTMFFGIEMTLAATASLCFAWPQPLLTWSGSAVWTESAGQVLAALGLMLVVRGNHTAPSHATQVNSVEELSGDVTR